MTAYILTKVPSWVIGIYIILAMPRVETRGSESKRESEQKNRTKKWAISCSHTVL